MKKTVVAVLLCFCVYEYTVAEAPWEGGTRQLKKVAECLK